MVTTPVYADSGYQRVTGETFFLLADSGFSSDEVATVRLEAPDYSSEINDYGGVDIAVYRVPDPMRFLQAQRNLHRIRLDAQYQGEGVANTVAYLWHDWYTSSRKAWQQMFTSQSRKQVLQVAPNLNQPLATAPNYVQANQYKPLAGFKMVSRFRYPIQKAQAIQPPTGVKLEGSSSDFVQPNAGNVRVPVGKLAAGLYVVEAIVGSYRATTLLFVADTVAVTKLSGSQLLVWTANKKNGQPVAGSQLAWTDGAGTLLSGQTNDQGVLLLNKASPERSYVMGTDPQGGVFVSENFYYDSEIYAAKVLAVTDRPLYRPNDDVHIKLIGREFSDALHSQPLAAEPVDVQIVDANGTPLFNKTVTLNALDGAGVDFRLPANADAGGYQVRTRYRQQTYNASFRVARYVKPHYEINLVLDKPVFHTGEAVTGKIQLNYPDGKPVANAALALTVKAQKLSLVDDHLDYTGQLQVSLKNSELKTNSEGIANFKLPAATDPSRYVVSLLSADSAAYRVSTTKEILVQAGLAQYRLQADKQFSRANEIINVNTQALTQQPAPNGMQWEAIRLEDRSTQRGNAQADGGFSLSLPKAGSYSLRLLDQAGNLLGATSHTVSGEGQKVTTGSIGIVFDKAQYRAGDVAHALISFDRPVSNALLTLERDKVEANALLTKAGDWLSVRQITPSQWQADIPVKADYGPNMTFSVMTVGNNQYQFQNRGLLVALPRVSLSIKTDKTSYLPNEQVNVDIAATVDGKPVNARLFASVVDEMVYALQPEIGPDVFDFFYHVRRNNVRTSTSLNFHSYDMALSPQVAPPASSNHYDRPFKVMERPRREDKDTAAWLPSLTTDNTGHSRFSFKMPDSLTRWRITVRAQTPEGVVGQATGNVLSDKPLYLKWLGPRQFRVGDQPQLTMAIFNSRQQEQNASLSVEGLATPLTRDLTLKAGANYVSFPAEVLNRQNLTLRVRQGDKEVDAIAGSLQAVPLGWLSTHSQHLTLSKPLSSVQLPAGASNISLAFADSSTRTAYSRVMEQLIEYPYGCVEQTSSRLIPLALALDNATLTPTSLPVVNDLEQRLQSGRLRLVQMAGPEARFSWWGNQTEGSAFMSAYAYYADELAARHLRISLPADHAQPVLDAYSKYASRESLWNQAITLWLLQRMQQPTQTLLSGVAAQLIKTKPTQGKPSSNGSWVLTDRNTLMPEERAMTITLLNVIARQNRQALPPELQKEFPLAFATVNRQTTPMARALALLASANAGIPQATRILEDIGSDYPSIDRSLTLIWVDAALSGKLQTGIVEPTLADPAWQAQQTLLGTRLWRYQGVPAMGKPLLVPLAAAPTTPINIWLNYSSVAPEPHSLPVTIERRLYRLTPTKESLRFRADVVPATGTGATWQVQDNDLYVDEVVLTPAAGQRYRYGLLEVPLPAGANVEGTTWGLKISGLKGDVTLNANVQDNGALSYSVPITELSGAVVVRQLVRFGQVGQFSLPPARYWRMYQPNNKAFEGAGKLAGHGVQVR